VMGDRVVTVETSVMVLCDVVALVLFVHVDMVESQVPEVCVALVTLVPVKVSLIVDSVLTLVAVLVVVLTLVAVVVVVMILQLGYEPTMVPFGMQVQLSAMPSYKSPHSTVQVPPVATPVQLSIYLSPVGKLS